MAARIELVKLISSKGKEKGQSVPVKDNAKIIKKLEEEIIQKHKLTDKVEILKKALELFKTNIDKYLKL